MIQRIATITLPATEPRHWEGGDVAGKTFDIRSVHHDVNGGYVWVLYEGYYFRGLAYLDLGDYKIRSRAVVRDYQGMRGALMDRVPGEGALGHLADLLTEGTAAAIILEAEGYRDTAGRLAQAVNRVLDEGGYGFARLTCPSDEPMNEIDLDLAGLDEMFTPLEHDE